MYLKLVLFIFVYPRISIAEEVNEDLAGIVYAINVEEFGDPYEVNLTNVGKSDSKIVNGDMADKFEFPYQVAVYINRPIEQSFCGGCLISDKFILTAAHCTYIRPVRIIAVLGTRNLWSGSKYERRIDVVRYIANRNFNRATLRNDISILELRYTVQFNKAIRPANLPRYSDARKNYIHKTGIASGYGQIHDHSNTVNQLRFSLVKVMDNLICNRAFNDVEATYTNICTTGIDHRGPCHGDSGGPLLIDKKLMGIVSYGADHCTAGYPVVYTRVPRYLEWISYNTGIKLRD